MVSLLAKAVGLEVGGLLSYAAVAPGAIDCRVTLSGNEMLWVEELAVCALCVGGLAWSITTHTVSKSLSLRIEIRVRAIIQYFSVL